MCGNLTAKKNDSLFVCNEGHQNWINPASAVSVFIIKDSKVLYGTRSNEPGRGKLDRPGGFIEVGETAEQAALREVKEELGVDVSLLDFLGSYATLYQGRPNLNFAFVAEITGGELVAGDGMDDFTWLGDDELPNEDKAAAPWFQDAQRDFIKWRRSQT